MIRIDINPSAASVAREIHRDLGHLDQSFTRASRRAVNRTTSWVKTRVIREVAAANNIPQKVLRRSRNPVSGTVTRRRRGRVFTIRARKGRDRATVWIGTRPIAAGYLGIPHQYSYGVKVRGRKFQRAFVATMPSGHRGVFHRKGRAHTPIKENYVRLQRAPAAVARIKQRIPAQLKKNLNHELDYELRIRHR